mgnify:FL=1|jgi:hypothetical protein
MRNLTIFLSLKLFMNVYRKKYQVLLQLHSQLQADIVLVELLQADDAYIVRVLGEDEVVLSSYSEAVDYANAKNREFYL